MGFHGVPWGSMGFRSQLSQTDPQRVWEFIGFLNMGHGVPPAEQTPYIILIRGSARLTPPRPIPPPLHCLHQLAHPPPRPSWPPREKPSEERVGVRGTVPNREAPLLEFYLRPRLLEFYRRSRLLGFSQRPPSAVGRSVDRSSSSVGLIGRSSAIVGRRRRRRRRSVGRLVCRSVVRSSSSPVGRSVRARCVVDRSRGDRSVGRRSSVLGRRSSVVGDRSLVGRRSST